MDTRSAASLSDPAGALERFSAEHGPEIEHLRRARSHTEERLGEVRGQLSAESIPPDISVAVFGSWARHELTEQSDDDWAVLVREGSTAGPDERDPRLRPRDYQRTKSLKAAKRFEGFPG